MENPKNVGRNDPCPCGSGKKYKNCCMSEPQLKFDGLPYGMRVKGGIRYDPEAGGFVVIVHIWDNVECRGEPQEWRYPKVYDDEDEALRYYKTHIGPGLIQVMQKNVEKSKTGVFIHRKLE
ncbi:MAG: SEC-C metal-binding domain-containing protein [candidate division KSB1 bacterium]|nr:SEC-C metal-binding domain-containing protein [candidate division KSB1 bacterium]MDZ7303271.1 SEC-C metal-binding domain-containing protein [candidate division KSB1 bacterium]MDZ7312575.1 SEC-C metal-binding domain-containing protein [candidate division KSB1 bacterium]